MPKEPPRPAFQGCGILGCGPCQPRAKRCRRPVFFPVGGEAMCGATLRPLSGAEYEAFRRRYPFDDDTHNYLHLWMNSLAVWLCAHRPNFTGKSQLRQSSPPEVRRQVLQSFKPPREGEADYSALLISFCKKMREQRPMQQVATVAHLGKGGGYDVSLQNIAAAPWHQPPWHQPFHQPPPPPPPRGGFRGGERLGYGDGFGGFEQRAQGDYVQLQMFRQRYPMDERAFEFLKNAQPWVRQEVLEKFAPQRQDSDYSALVISFAKKCREREQAGGLEAKRPRLGY